MIEPHFPLSTHGILGILNGTAFSASVAALALNDAVHLTLLAQVCTALGTEALLGSRGSFDPFIHYVARPHPGQVKKSNRTENTLFTFYRSSVLEIFGICWRVASWQKPMRKRSPSTPTNIPCARTGIRYAHLLSSSDLRSKIFYLPWRLLPKSAIPVRLKFFEYASSLTSKI